MQSKYSVEEIFRPKSFPEYTYIARKMDNQSTYEDRLRRALRISGGLISITGASKSGKTVLCHKVIDKKDIIDLSGAQIQIQSDFWNQIAEKIGLPDEIQFTETKSKEKGIKGQAGTGIQISFIPSFKIGGQAKVSQSIGENIALKNIRNNTAIIKYLIENNKVLVIDDFHYINDELQLYIARILKTELFNGLKAIVLSLPHRADDTIKHNPDLIGRTTFIKITAWKKEELEEIAKKGFKLLGYSIDKSSIELLAQESIASPQLMQENCFNLADIFEVNNCKTITIDLVKAAFNETVLNYTHYDEILSKVLRGPAQGRNKRKKYLLLTGEQADIYMLLLIAISTDPPVVSMHLEEIKERLLQILKNKNDLPRPLAIANAVSHIEKIIKNAVPKLDTIEWKDQCLYILDPFLLFYLRWNTSWKQLI